MTTIHAQLIGNQALLPHHELERLLELARRSEEIDLQIQVENLAIIEDDDVPTLSIMRLAERGGAFDFWHEEGEDIYSAEDGEPV